MKRVKKILACLMAAVLMCASLPVGAAAAVSDYKTSWNGVTYYHSPDEAAGKSILPGVDVSQWQGDIDWETVASSGIRFAMIRLGYTDEFTGEITSDPAFKTNIEGAKAAGISVGVYYRSQATTVSGAIEEAEFVLKQLGSYSLDLPVAIDYEYYDGGTVTSSYPDKATKTAILNAFCDTVSAAGYRAAMYLNTGILQYDVNADDLNSDYVLWLARWTTEVPEYSGSYEIWQCSSTQYVDGISTVVDLDWWYTSAESLVKDSSGRWVYQVDGVTDYTYTGLAGNSSGMWYVQNGVVDFSFTGFAEDGGEKWYVLEGKVQSDTNSVVKDKYGTIGDAGDWYYVVGGRVQTDFTGLADYKNSYGWWYIVDGRVDFTHNGVEKNKNGWWYVTDGKVQFEFTGLANYRNSYGWWYIVDGKVDFDYSGFASNVYGEWYLEGGKVIFSENGVIKDKAGAIGDAGTWYYVVGGQVQNGYTGVADYKNSYGWWYIRDGAVDFDYSGFGENVNGKWYCEDGRVKFDQSSVIKDKTGAIGDAGTWYYVVESRVQSGFTGLADYKNSYGWWYIRDGVVDFTANTVAKNKNGWWYIVGGKVDFSYNGVAQNINGWWYIVDGKVDFSYNGTVNVSGNSCRVENGKLTGIIS